MDVVRDLRLLCPPAVNQSQ